MSAIDLTPEERELLTCLLLKHRDDTPPDGGDHDHYFLRKKLKLTYEEWADPNREILT